MATRIPEKKAAIFGDDDSSEDDQEEGGAQLKVNEEFARRFEHNKKREELQRLEEKYKNEPDEDEDDSSDDESEDDDAYLATEDLDRQISATLQAIKNKDPSIYDKDHSFYAPPGESSGKPREKKAKPVFLRDYHREKLLNGDIGADEVENGVDGPKTYVQEQADLKESVLAAIKTADSEDDDAKESGDDGFLTRKETEQPVPVASTENGVHPSRAARIKITESDVENAEKDPELFLSNFMAARAWIPEDAGSKWAAFESDEDADDDMADQFEEAYNMRFEDPEKSNEVLRSYSRQATQAKSVRREEPTGRKKQRELEKERKQAAKRDREEERARLRNLKVEEAQGKLKKIKQAAGMSGKTVKDEDWTKFLEDAWENDKWEEEMNRRFGEEYYAEAEEEGLSDGDEEEGAASKKLKKPKWDDDIDIKDLVPDFDDSRPDITLSDEEQVDGDEAAEDNEGEDEDAVRPAKKRKTAKDRKKEQLAAKKEGRKERAKIEAFVDAQLELDDPSALAGPSKDKSKRRGGTGAFRYRETSPTSFGMTARDILLAPSDAALNQFAGIKKLASFRDAEKKRKDKKKLGKKARLRQWRKDTFGQEFEHTGPTYGFDKFREAEAMQADSAKASDKNKKRKRKDKAS